MSDFNFNLEKESKMSEGSFGFGVALGVGFLLFGGVSGCMYGYPRYAVYEQRLAGEAELARASYSKQVAVQEAQAKLDSARLLNQAEIARAEGGSGANKIIADGLGGPEGYLRYLYIQGLENRKGDTIYIPTEAGLPILEARPKK